MATQITFGGVAVTGRDIRRAAREFDTLYPRTEQFDGDWTRKDNYRYALRLDGSIYPLKWIMAQAAGLDKRAFYSGPHIIGPLERLGSEVISRPFPASGRRPTGVNAPAPLLETAAAQSNDLGEFDPNSDEDARERIVAAIVQRRGQPEFREALLRAYGNACAITGCMVTDTLEAAHIVPYKGDQTNHAVNGILLRADLHVLFNRGLLTVDSSTMRVVLDPSIRHSEYGDLHGRKIRVPSDPLTRPNPLALDNHGKCAGL